MDREAFRAACLAVNQGARGPGGIGTLGEKTLHAALKRTLEPDTACHEINCGPYVADIWNDQGFIEIQTRQLYRLRDKLELFLTRAPVTVVYPVPAVKRIVWVGEDGSLSEPHPSSKRYQAWEILPELYGLTELIGREGLRFLILLLEVEDYRLLNGWSKDKKRGSTRLERMPVDLLGQLELHGREEFRQLVPEGLGETFTRKDFQRITRFRGMNLGKAVKVMEELGAVEQTGKQGRAFVYRRKEA